MALTPRVFVVQEPAQVPRVTGGLRPKIDLLASGAGDYGELIYCLEWSEGKDLSPGEMFARLARKLHTYDFARGDYLLAIGHPGAMTMAASICMAATDGKVRLLWWDRERRSYITYPLDFDTLSAELEEPDNDATGIKH